MKRLIFLLCLMTTIPVFAETVTTEIEPVEATTSDDNKNSYFLARISIPTFRLETTGNWDQKHKMTSWGWGVDFGTRVASGLNFELMLDSAHIMLDGHREEDEIFLLSVLPGLRYDYEITNWFRPYVGAAIGLTMAVNSVYHTTVTQIGMVTHTNTGTDTLVRFNLSWQFTAGLLFRVGEITDLDIGVRYVNMGRVKNTGDYFDVNGSITNFEYRIGLAFKF
ncbi:outer membrane beta-barrel protein [Lachnospiraceae bacterium OttesenSCG-928-E19]|nr:outer membrane beta-barrel protein [Lachnospiraceae bacterium OttesenSCG-928-E19]